DVRTRAESAGTVPDQIRVQPSVIVVGRCVGEPSRRLGTPRHVQGSRCSCSRRPCCGTTARLRVYDCRAKGAVMRVACWSAFVVALFLRAHQKDVKEIRAISPGVVYNAGLLDLAAAYGKETGVKVTVTSSGMGRIVNDIKTANPPADVIFLPFE